MASSKEFLKAKRQRIYEELVGRLGGRCELCASTEELEFDHLNPLDKTQVRWLPSIGRDKIEEELPKVRLLCRPCHLKWSHASATSCMALLYFTSLRGTN